MDVCLSYRIDKVKGKQNLHRGPSRFCSSRPSFSVRSLRLCRPSCRSPILSRRSPQLDDTPVENGCNHCTLSPPSVALRALDGNGQLTSLENDTCDRSPAENPSSPSQDSLSTANAIDHCNNKRSLDSSSSERVLVKRRSQKMIPSNSSWSGFFSLLWTSDLLVTVVQQDYCTSYPGNIQRCIDCRLADSSSSLSMHLGGCRFQHCRKWVNIEKQLVGFCRLQLIIDACAFRLRYLGDNRYTFEGFLTAAQAEAPENEFLSRSNNSGKVKDMSQNDRCDNWFDRN